MISFCASQCDVPFARPCSIITPSLRLRPAPPQLGHHRDVSALHLTLDKQQIHFGSCESRITLAPNDSTRRDRWSLSNVVYEGETLASDFGWSGRLQ